MGKEQNDLRALIALGTSSTASRDEQSGEVVDSEYERLAREVRDKYVGLINTYGKSSGEVVEETQLFPTHSKFSMFYITSSRTCPSIAVKLKERQTMYVELGSIAHIDRTSHPDKVYDPPSLTSIFSEDWISFRVSVKREIFVDTSRRITAQNKWYSIRPTDVMFSGSIFDSAESTGKIKLPGQDRKARKEELEGLLAIVPFLEAQYQLLRPPALPAAEPEQRRSRGFLPFLGRLLPGR